MAYTDLTAAFAYKNLLTWQLMDELGENDSYNHFPSGTTMPFFQASAPTGWTKDIAFDDGMLRVTSGAGAGSGGAAAVSTGISIAHTHTLSGHTHDLSHVHDLDYTLITDFTDVGAAVSLPSDTAEILLSSGASSPRRSLKNNTKSGDGGTSGSSSATSDSPSTPIILAYIDTIICVKV